MTSPSHLFSLRCKLGKGLVEPRVAGAHAGAVRPQRDVCREVVRIALGIVSGVNHVTYRSRLIRDIGAAVVKASVVEEQQLTGAQQ